MRRFPPPVRRHRSRSRFRTAGWTRTGTPCRQGSGAQALGRAGQHVGGGRIDRVALIHRDRMVIDHICVGLVRQVPVEVRLESVVVGCRGVGQLVLPRPVGSPESVRWWCPPAALSSASGPVVSGDPDDTVVRPRPRFRLRRGQGHAGTAEQRRRDGRSDHTGTDHTDIRSTMKDPVRTWHTVSRSFRRAGRISPESRGDRGPLPMACPARTVRICRRSARRVVVGAPTPRPGSDRSARRPRARDRTRRRNGGRGTCGCPRGRRGWPPGRPAAACA